MRNQAVVATIDQGAVWVVPMLGQVCISCERTGCAKHGTPFRVVNTAGLPVKRGDIVVITASHRAKTLQGLFALFFPVAAAVSAYFAATPILRLWGAVATEGNKAAAVLIGIAAAAAIVLLAGKYAAPLTHPEITAITDSANGSGETDDTV